MQSIYSNTLYTIAADEEKETVEKEVEYSSTTANLLYMATVDGTNYIAFSSEILDEFVKALQAADTDEKKTAVFKQFANTEDKALAQTLAREADTLKASKEDVLAPCC